MDLFCLLQHIAITNIQTLEAVYRKHPGMQWFSFFEVNGLIHLLDPKPDSCVWLVRYKYPPIRSGNPTNPDLDSGKWITPYDIDYIVHNGENYFQNLSPFPFRSPGLLQSENSRPAFKHFVWFIDWLKMLSNFIRKLLWGQYSTYLHTIVSLPAHRAYRPSEVSFHTQVQSFAAKSTVS